MRTGVCAVVDVTAVQEGIVLAVCGEDLAKTAAFFHSLPHHALRLHAAPIVGKGDDIRRQAGKICELVAFFTNCNGSVGVDMDTGIFFDDCALNIQ